MVSVEPLHSLPEPASPESDAGSSPRISFSSELFDESNFITICPNPEAERELEAAERARIIARSVDFEFLSGNNDKAKMITADELISEGKLLPFREIHYAERLINGITVKSDGDERVSDETEAISKEESRITWFIDEDPSPRPPKCTVLWKELLKLKKQRPSTLSPSASSSSSSSSSSSVADAPSGDKRSREKDCSKRTKKKGQERERSRSSSIRIRPVLNVPICTQAKNAAALPPLFSMRKARLGR